MIFYILTSTLVMSIGAYLAIKHLEKPLGYAGLFLFVVGGAGLIVLMSRMI